MDEYPSVQSPALLMNLLKLKKENAKWTDERVAEYMKLPECQVHSKKSNKPNFNRQKVRLILSRLGISYLFGRNILAS